jgi:predicted dehydrogenase
MKNRCIGLIGAGYWGKKILSSLIEIDTDCLIRVCDADLAVASRLGERYPKISVTTDQSELLSDPAVGAVMVALPPALHFELGMEVLKAGKHLFLEKPMVQKLADARKINDAARDSNLIVMVGLTYRYNLAVDRIAQIVKSGRLGRVSKFYSWRTNLNLRTKHANVVWMLAPHDISIFQHWAGRSAQSVRVQPDRAAKQNFEQDAFVDMDFGDGLEGHVHFSWLVPGKTRRLVVVGEKKVLVYDELAAPDALFVYGRGRQEWPTDLDEASAMVENLRAEPEVLGFEQEYEPPLVRECRHFLDCLHHGQRPLTDGIMAEGIVRAIRAMLLSGREGGRIVKVDEATD